MVRRVKAYLKNMKVITDEEKLLAMSMECDPPSGGAQIAQPSVCYFMVYLKYSTLYACSENCKIVCWCNIILVL